MSNSTSAYHRLRGRVRLLGVASAVALLTAGLLQLGAPLAHAADASHSAATTNAPPAYAYYYMWWDTAHWHSTLGSKYPYSDNPLPLPATLAATGCTPASLYKGNIETDVPAELFTQDSQSQINLDVNNAIAAGLSGFAANWKGTGSPTQTPSSSALDGRFDMLVRAVDAAQAAGHSFHLWLSYEASASTLAKAAVVGDLSYFTSQYGHNRAFSLTNGGKPTFIWVGSYKYSASFVGTVSADFRPLLYFVGGYQYNQWNTRVSTSFDADSPYWSSQNPYANPQSFTQLSSLAATLRSEGKQYFAPLSPGFDRQLDGSAGCVPRDGGATLRAIWNGNITAHPNDWLVISWNEITEGTYITPQLERYGATYGGPAGVLHGLLSSPH